MRGGWVLRRVAMALPLAVGIVLVSFILLRVMPGDPVDIMLRGGGTSSEEEARALARQLGLDQPLPVQLARFVADLARGDLGESIRSRQPVGQMLRATLPATVELALAALVFAVAVGVALGVLAATRRGSWLDRAVMAVASLGVSMPAFWFGIVLMLVLAVGTGWLPTSGRIASQYAGTVPWRTGFLLIDTLLAGNGAAFRSAVAHLVLPAVTLGAELAAVVARVTRSSMLEVLGAEFIRTARAKGLHERRVILVHALRNALIPTASVVGLQAGVLLGGNMIVETVFSWPGLGRLVVEAIFARDYPVVQGAVMVYALTFLVMNLLVDLAYTWLDPRIREA
ncbi:binding-protein-dependent transport systems inner membrane component [Thermaerobacter marianensis DSM 12885]|uniref:Binding-protein-dependent transport systems inner membrane component n=1 Tax=Thermaerobacter marianensis (strain ATCC 700841 / DSM 12885 / JCM 10246 / 7p75a) TaxID=644966 RepID=E6SI84_THEM7|nr:ABC transporter permease [Thermaerobacter marianensis]ADU50862.1 binding-protein-dependent transport systems inner membrane component [Thermaerobacter marianensis DSM 12885]